MIRIITWLDPHQTDVYQTGAWHMDYNFTDNSQRSDRRYTLAELVDRGYEDAYRQFVEPVVAASGDRIASVQS